MRVFVGIPVSEENRERIVFSLKPLKRACPSVKWVKKENLHLTLCFIGDVPEENLAGYTESLGLVGFSSFELLFSGLKLMPAGSPRIIYLEIEKGQNEVMALAGKVRETLDKNNLSDGIDGKKGNFLPHLTLGRIKDRFSARLLESRKERVELSVRETISFFMLYESRLFPQGPEYIEIAKIKCL